MCEHPYAKMKQNIILTNAQVTNHPGSESFTLHPGALSDAGSVMLPSNPPLFEKQRKQI